ncbi:MAG: asparagine synthase C-terminal domain-containing protein [Lachnospiraceae bacterium]
MAGFFVSNFVKEINYDFVNNSVTCIKKEIETEKYIVKQYTSSKFLDDKVFLQNKEGDIYIIEGYILNKKDLIYRFKGETWINALENMKLQKKDYFMDFRGSFSGASYCLKDDEWIFYTNHLGDCQVFYWNQDDKFIVTSDMNWMVDALKSKGMVYTLNKKAAMSIMSYGWVEGDETIIAEVKKILPGHCIKIKNILSVYQYHRFVNTKFTSQSEDEIIEEIDKKFCHAVKLEYEKDREYGYKHIATLSGGLDSRMNVWVAKEMGYDPITAITFGQSRGEDISISNQIATKLRIPHFIKNLDDADFFNNIPNAVKDTFGLIAVAGTIHGDSMLQCLDLSKFGIIHTGQAGDAILGSRWKCHIKPSSLVGSDSNIALIPYNRNWENEELYFFYERVMHWTLGIHCKQYEQSMYASPFIQVDFMEYCLSIPLRYRYEHYIYKKWILKKHPKAADFNWENLGGKISDSKRIIKLKNFVKECKRKINKVSKQNQGMNPFDYWYESIPERRRVLDDMFESLLKMPLLDTQFSEIIKRMYNIETCRGKIRLISALYSIKSYF